MMTKYQTQGYKIIGEIKLQILYCDSKQGWGSVRGKTRPPRESATTDQEVVRNLRTQVQADDLFNRRERQAGLLPGAAACWREGRPPQKNEQQRQRWERWNWT